MLNNTLLSTLLGLLCLVWDFSIAQEAETNPSEHVMTVLQDAEVKNALLPLTEKMAHRVVQISDSKKSLILGTVVSRDGLVVTKASELSGLNYQCRFYDGTQANAKMIGSSEVHDLALLQVEIDVELPVNFIQPISFPDKTADIKAGKFVVFAGTKNDQPRLGAISLDGREFSIESQGCTDCVDWGVTCKLVQSAKRLTGPGKRFSSALVVQKVQPRSLAEQSGLQIGDEIESINGQNMTDPSLLDAIAQSLGPGDQVVVEIRRSGESTQLTTHVSRFSNRVSHDRWGGGPYSRRRFGFSSMLTHDIPISPAQCGSPLIDLHGNVVGINIARSLRVATLAIPVQQVKDFVLAIRPNADVVTD